MIRLGYEGIEYILNANVRPLVGDSVLVRGVVIAFGSPIKYDGKNMLLCADGLDGLPSVIGSISNRFSSKYKTDIHLNDLQSLLT